MFRQTAQLVNHLRELQHTRLRALADPVEFVGAADHIEQLDATALSRGDGL